MKQRIYWLQEVCIKLKVSKKELYDFLIDSGFCHYRQSQSEPIVYKRFAKPLKLRKRPEHGYFVLRKDEKTGSKYTFVTEDGLEFIQEHIHETEFVFDESYSR